MLHEIAMFDLLPGDSSYLRFYLYTNNIPIMDNEVDFKY